MGATRLPDPHGLCVARLRAALGNRSWEETAEALGMSRSSLHRNSRVGKISAYAIVRAAELHRINPRFVLHGEEPVHISQGGGIAVLGVAGRETTGLLAG
jgi:hypothetical protein